MFRYLKTKLSKQVIFYKNSIICFKKRGVLLTLPYIITPCYEINQCRHNLKG